SSKSPMVSTTVIARRHSRLVVNSVGTLFDLPCRVDMSALMAPPFCSSIAVWELRTQASMGRQSWWELRAELCGQLVERRHPLSDDIEARAPERLVFDVDAEAAGEGRGVGHAGRGQEFVVATDERLR